MFFSGLVKAQTQTREAAQLCQLEYIFGTILSYVLGFAGIVLFIYLIIGGFKYITSEGNSQKVEQAKSTLTYAIGGLVVIVLSFFIINLIATFTGAGNTITSFRIYNGINPCPEWETQRRDTRPGGPSR
ncbi:MAG: pilin [Patescibacteria group bacterium]|nr:pilin [Patescibacteria group bacterium]